MWEIILCVVLLVLGMFFLIKGADWFVEGASSIAKSIGIPSLVIGLTLVSIGTSMPEMSVSLQSSLAGLNDMGFGNVVGSNIFNTFVVIGLSALLVPLVVSKEMKKFDLPILIGIYVLLILFAFVISPFILAVWESIILFSFTITYTVFLIARSWQDIKNSKENKEEEQQRKWWLNVILVVVGAAGIIFGGDLVVDNASFIALKIGMSDLLVGLTIVAVGTSLPELVTSVVAAKKGENDIAIGNAVGSSMFNIVLILGFCSAISPVSVELSSLVDCIVMLLSAVMILLFSLKTDKVNKWQGMLMLVIYVGYVAYIILRNVYGF